MALLLIENLNLLRQAAFAKASLMGRSPRRKGGDRVVPTKRGKGTKLMVLVDGSGLPLAIDDASDSPAAVTLIEPLIDEALVDEFPQRLIYDRAADSDPLHERLAERGIELIFPHRRPHVRSAPQDGRPLRPL